MNNIGQLFDDISAKYDRFNHVTSLGIDKYWRKKAIRAMQPAESGDFLRLIAPFCHWFFLVICFSQQQAHLCAASQQRCCKATGELTTNL